jgi:hypothetical protein
MHESRMHPVGAVLACVQIVRFAHITSRLYARCILRNGQTRELRRLTVAQKRKNETEPNARRVTADPDFRRKRRILTGLFDALAAGVVSPTMARLHVVQLRGRPKASKIGARECLWSGRNYRPIDVRIPSCAESRLAVPAPFLADEGTRVFRGPNCIQYTVLLP